MSKWGMFINQRQEKLPLALELGAEYWTIITANPAYIALGEQIRKAVPNATIVYRYYDTGQPLHREPRAVARYHFDNFYTQHCHITNAFYPLNEPQLETEGVDCNDWLSVRNMWGDLNLWMLAYVDEFRRLAPDAYIIFPPPAPGLYWDTSQDLTMAGVEICGPAIYMCDAVAQNIYWPGSEDGRGIYFDKEWYADRYLMTYEATKRPIWISECNGNINANNWGNQMLQFFLDCQERDFVLGVTCFLLQAHDGQFPTHNVYSRPNHGADDMLLFSSNLESGETMIPIQLEDALREQAWNMLAIPYNKDAALAKYARAHSLGAPKTPEFDKEYLGRWWRAQGFEKGIIYAEVGRWTEIHGPISY